MLLFSYTLLSNETDGQMLRKFIIFKFQYVIEL